jgi:hypothetical protein
MSTMFHSRPFSPTLSSNPTLYAEYISATTVPTHTLQRRLGSLSDRQSRLYAERCRLGEEERQIKQQTGAILRCMRAQRLRDAIDEAEIEDIVETVLEQERDGERAIRDAIMYYSTRKTAR